MTDTDLARMANDEMSSIPYFQLNLPTNYVVLFVALIQLALRCPEMDPGSKAHEAGRWLINSVRESFAGYPSVQALIDRGDSR